MPWTPILMVSGVTVLIALLEKTGGLDLVHRAPCAVGDARHRDRRRRVRDGHHLGLQQHVGRRAPRLPADDSRTGRSDSVAAIPLSIATSMNVGAHLVDMSPLSTTGAMCLAGITDPAEVRPTYNKLLAWGLSMTVIGSLLCWIFF